MGRFGHFELRRHLNSDGAQEEARVDRGHRRQSESGNLPLRGTEPSHHRLVEHEAALDLPIDDFAGWHEPVLLVEGPG